MGRKSKKHKGTSDGSNNEADDDRHGTSNLISGMGGANFHMNPLVRERRHGRDFSRRSPLFNYFSQKALGPGIFISANDNLKI